ncbi:PAS domain-containing protein [Zavarzinia sp. CC-PAN008]|uniref:PAS domain-containing protein n=1 Tax=Zavarzinia sp. CC-PAN008 TaxID=3243332 RepID=UPI003F74A29E
MIAPSGIAEPALPAMRARIVERVAAIVLALGLTLLLFGVLLAILPAGDRKGAMAAMALATAIGIGLAALNRHRLDRAASAAGAAARADADQRAATILDSTTDGILEVAADGTILFFNTRALELAGLTPAHLGRNVREIWPAMNIEAFAQRRALVPAGMPVAYESFHPASAIWLDVRAFPTRNGGLAVYMADITRRKQSEQALAQSRALLERVVEILPEPVFAKDREGRILLANSALAALLDRDRDSLAGCLDMDALPPELHAIVREINRLVVDEGQEVTRILEYSSRRHGGETRCTSLRIVPWRENGEIVGQVGVAVDLTDIRRSEQALSESRLLLERVIAALPDSVSMKGRDGRYLLLNASAAQRIGLASVADGLGRTAREVMAPDQADWVERIDRQVLESGEPMTVEEGPHHSEQAGRTFLTTRLPFRDPAGAPVGVLAVARDITERKALEQQLRNAQRLEAIGRLAGGIAHDFNNLLLAIIANIELVQTVVKDNGQAQEFLEDALQAALRGGDLTQRLLGFARQQPLRPTAVDVNARLHQVMPMLQRTIGEAITVRFDLEPDLWPAEADPAQVDAALVNLALNARDAMPDGGTLTLTTRNVTQADDGGMDTAPPGDYVRISVIDTGSGMAPDVLARAVEPFFTTKEQGKGSGLGLSQIYGFAKQSHGHFALSSRSGAGTTARLDLPRTQAEAKIEPVTGRMMSSLPRGNELILIVEDQAAARRASRSALEALGYRVVEADSGPVALQRLAAHDDLRLVFSDVILPGGMTGFDIARIAGSERPGLRVLLTSGYDAPALGQGVAPGALAFLPKPYRIADLAHKVRAVLDAAS